MSIKIEVLNTDDQGCYDFIRQSEGKISSLPRWSTVIAQSTPINTYYLVAREQNEICGVLSLGHSKSVFFGNYMVSQPMSNYGGIFAESSTTRDALFDHAVKLATELECSSIEFRNIKPLPYDLELRTGKMCMYLPLTEDTEQMWKGFSGKVRNHVRKAEKSGLTAISGHIELLDDFYHIYSARMHQLGTPPYPRKLMENIMKSFLDSTRIFVVYLDKLTVAAGFTMWFNGFVEIPWAAALVQHNRLCPNNLLYWDIIKHFGLSGSKCFDFGRCTVDGPTYNFKKNWGTEPVYLNYQYWVRPGQKLSVSNPSNLAYKRKIELWKKLPLSVTRLAGPYLSRYLP